MSEDSAKSGAPQITAVQWLSAKEVLGGEATDFTPWLLKAESMQILGNALKVDDLTAVTSELNVLGKRLDILATALDESGDEIPVCIENQYGTSDADHLGRLIAYLAHQGRGRAVWVVEHAHDAYVAAVRFLNRTSTDEVGYYLVKVQFTHGFQGSYQVHFEVLAAPIAWEKGSKAGSAQPKALNQPKVSYLATILDSVKASLLAAGFSSLNTHTRGAYLWIRWPTDLWFRKFGARLDIRITRTMAMVVLYVRTFPTKQANELAMSILQDRYNATLLERLPEGSVINWAPAGSGHRVAVRVERAGSGYDGGDAQTTAAWAESVATTWLELLREEPIHNLESLVDTALPEEALAPSDEDDLEEDE